MNDFSFSGNPGRRLNLRGITGMPLHSTPEFKIVLLHGEGPNPHSKEEPVRPIRNRFMRQEVQLTVLLACWFNEMQVKNP